MSEHTWPEPGDHLWGEWMPHSRTVIYRVCVHPECTASEKKEAKS